MQAAQQTADRREHLFKAVRVGSAQKLQAQGELEAGFELAVRSERDTDVNAFVPRRQNPSATFAGMETAAWRIWLVSP